MDVTSPKQGGEGSRASSELASRHQSTITTLYETFKASRHPRETARLGNAVFGAYCSDAVYSDYRRPFLVVCLRRSPPRHTFRISVAALASKLRSSGAAQRTALSFSA